MFCTYCAAHDPTKDAECIAEGICGDETKCLCAASSPLGSFADWTTVVLKANHVDNIPICSDAPYDAFMCRDGEEIRTKPVEWSWYE